MSVGTLTPAFGRDYRTKNETLVDFYNSLDFVFNNVHSRYDGKYCSYYDFSIGDELTFRYNQLRDVFVHTVTKKPLATLVFSDPNRNFSRASKVVEAFVQGSTFYDPANKKHVTKDSFNKGDILFLKYLSRGKDKIIFYTVK